MNKVFCDKEREIAIKIINEFEELLEYHEIDIKDEDREGQPEEARIYGKTYYRLEDTVIDILKEEDEELKREIELHLRDILDDCKNFFKGKETGQIEHNVFEIAQHLGINLEENN